MRAQTIKLKSRCRALEAAACGQSPEDHAATGPFRIDEDLERLLERCREDLSNERQDLDSKLREIHSLGTEIAGSSQRSLCLADEQATELRVTAAKMTEIQDALKQKCIAKRKREKADRDKQEADQRLNSILKPECSVGPENSAFQESTRNAQHLLLNSIFPKQGRTPI